MPRYHPQDATLGRATWSVGHYGEVFGVTAPEAYVPRMVDRGYTLEEDHGSFLGSGWEEEAPEADLFQEPHGSLDNYPVPLISQEQAYANHGMQVNQVTASVDDTGTAASLPPGEARWGPHGGSQERGTSPCRAKLGNARS